MALLSVVVGFIDVKVAFNPGVEGPQIAPSLLLALYSGVQFPCICYRL